MGEPGDDPFPWVALAVFAVLVVLLAVAIVAAAWASGLLAATVPGVWWAAQ